MLNQLIIRNFTIVDTLELELNTGMTVVSGETGAGKSIMLDALALALGARAEAGTVRKGADKADITAEFSIETIPEAKLWLQDNDMDNQDLCILRRVISAEGRSRCYINGNLSPANTVKKLGEYLIAIHGQHEHQRLLKKDYHRTLLDAFTTKTELASQVANYFREWSELKKLRQQLSTENTEQNARVQLLNYQINELEKLSLQVGELQQLEVEQKNLANAESILAYGHQFIELANANESTNANQLLNQCRQLLSNINTESIAITQAIEMIDSASIQVEEASNEVRYYLDKIEINPERQQEVENRLSLIYDIARKHSIQPDEIPDFYQQLCEELNKLDHSDEKLAELIEQESQAKQNFLHLAENLSKTRSQGAKQLSKMVDQQLYSLGMSAAHIEVTLTPLNTPTANGLEEVELKVITNLGQPAKPLAKIASGGELSRISLAIQVITAQTSATPSLIFDEVDVGIGGAIAEVVGKLLRNLGKRTQVLCVTHQPQVASQGNQHLLVKKSTDNNQTQTKINILDTNQRIQEIARMLGGVEITTNSIAHAKEMIAKANEP